MNKAKKDQLTAQNPEKAWQAIEELLLEDEEMTVEELDAELREFGIDPDESARRLYEIAQEISRKPNESGQVSPHITDILVQLAPKYFRSESNAPATHSQASKFQSRASSEGENQASSEESPKANVAVLGFHRNYKRMSPKDRAIRERNEKRLQAMVEESQQKKRNPE